MKLSPERLNTKSAATALAILIFGLALPGHLSNVSMNPNLKVETVAHMIASRSCSTGEGCLLRVLTVDGTMGSTTPIGIQHGALANHLMAVTETLTGNPLALGWVLAVMSALVSALMFLLGRKMWGLLAGLACAAATLMFLADKCGVLSHPAFTPLPTTLYVAAACAHLVTGRGRHIFVAGFAVGVAAQFHLAAFAHLAGLSALVLMARPKSRMTAGLFATAGVVLPLAASPAMFFIIKPCGGATGGPSDFLSSALLLGAGAGLLLLSVLHRRYGPTARVVRFLATTHLPFAIALLLFGHDFTTKYMLPILPGLAILLVAGAVHALSALAHRCRPRLPTEATKVMRLVAITTIAIAAVALLVKDVSIPRLPLGRIDEHHRGNDLVLSDAQAVAKLLVSEGWTYREVFRGLRGGEGFWYLLQGLGYYMPGDEPGVDHLPETRLALTVLAAPERPATLPAGWSWAGENDSPGILVRTYEPRLRWDQFEVCFTQAGREVPCEWSQLHYAYQPAVHPSQAHLVYCRGAPQIENLLSLQQGDVVLMAVPIRVPAGSDPRFITLGGSSWYGCAGAIVAVEGVGYDGSLPARSVWIDGSKLETHGTVIFGWERRDCHVGFAIDMPPAVMEFDASDLPVAGPLLEEEKRPEAPALLSVLDEIGAANFGRPIAPTYGRATSDFEQVVMMLEPMAPYWFAFLSSAFEQAAMKLEPLAPYWFAFLSVVLTALGMLAGIVSWGVWALQKPTVATDSLNSNDETPRGPRSDQSGHTRAKKPEKVS